MMSRCFECFYDCESFDFAPKTQIIKEILPSNRGSIVVIGDRIKDLECAQAVGASFVGCLYGYGREGELAGAQKLITDIAQLPGVLRKMGSVTEI